MKRTITLVAPLLLAACGSAAQLPPSTPDSAPPTWAAPASGPPADALTLSSAKTDSRPLAATAQEEQSKAPPSAAPTGNGDPQASQVFPDRRSVEAMDHLAISIPVRRTPRGDLVTLASDDTFEPGCATTTISARWRLEDIAVALAAQSNRKIRVEVYADGVGDANEARELSQLRADALRRYFVGHGAPAEAIEASGLGPARPLASNLTPEGRRTNRRIEIIVERPRE
jgi:outer membrane protein OmpA-like peptidoglycan-associated protein